MKTVLLPLLLFFFTLSALAIYDHGPAERYWDLLKNLNGNQLEYVQKIVYNPDHTKRQTLAKMNEWAFGQPVDVQKLFNQSLANFEARDKKRDEQLDLKDANLSVAGRELDAEIRAIYNNMDLTDKQTCESVTEVISSSSDVLQKELNIQPMNCDFIFKNLHKRN